ncbi:MAG: UDP-N-acetylglucosamine 2-epimerase (hydrolyzing) [Bacteroidia bacterium]|nr:MAG: UDP-N-acetylglucosamine 2-epimerase (hydrolyzing) [Bacteroidia bacterium]
MGRPAIKIGVLTSSRADYGIYLPLLRVLESDPAFNIELLVFGTHMSEKYGMTINEIRKDGFSIYTTLDTMPVDDGPGSIARSMGKTITEFTGIWNDRRYDYVIALGDRYEMFAAVASTVPYNIRVAHIHGGETTRGAIDNAFRHSISHMSDIHFAACDQYAERLTNMLDQGIMKVYNVGALSIDSLSRVKFYSPGEFLKNYSIDLLKPFLLVTFHPETIGYSENRIYIRELISALGEANDRGIVITMPNADTGSQVIREAFESFASRDKRVTIIENFGPRAYLTCMKYCSMMVGNSSSGFIEASFFPKPVINLGMRQDGRIRTPNIIDCDIKKDKIIESIRDAGRMVAGEKVKIYGTGDTSVKISEVLKDNYSKAEKDD